VVGKEGQTANVRNFWLFICIFPNFKLRVKPCFLDWSISVFGIEGGPCTTAGEIKLPFAIYCCYSGIAQRIAYPVLPHSTQLNIYVVSSPAFSLAAQSLMTVS
jgi:hypothetical protein